MDVMGLAVAVVHLLLSLVGDGDFMEDGRSGLAQGGQMLLFELGGEVFQGFRTLLQVDLVGLG